MHRQTVITTNAAEIHGRNMLAHQYKPKNLVERITSKSQSDLLQLLRKI
jgi:hypothetical protein